VRAIVLSLLLGFLAELLVGRGNGSRLSQSGSGALLG
jgi:hypothetical protein